MVQKNGEPSKRFCGAGLKLSAGLRQAARAGEELQDSRARHH